MQTLPRPRLAFSLRTLLVLVAAICAWLAWERHVVVKRRAVREQQSERIQFLTIAADDPLAAVVEPRQVSPLRRLLGDEAVQAILLLLDCTDAERRELAALFPEAEVDILTGVRNSPRASSRAKADQTMPAGYASFSSFVTRPLFTHSAT